MQESRLSSVGQVNGRLKMLDGPKTKQSGLYWIYTTYTDNELFTSTPSPKRKSVDFRNTITRHAHRAHVCNREVQGFRLVYNGIGGLGAKGSGGLRERILDEFRGGEGMGSLAVKGSSLNDLQKWRFSYVLWPEIRFEKPHEYAQFAEDIERLWRIHFGWPVLCTK